ncbi:hypothetical protein AVEN_43244-1, partial [Araneus ventricosus]
MESKIGEAHFTPIMQEALTFSIKHGLIPLGMGSCGRPYTLLGRLGRGG